MCAAVSAGVLLRKEHASSSARTSRSASAFETFEDRNGVSTFQPVNGPLLELFQRDLCCGWDFVEV